MKKKFEEPVALIDRFDLDEICASGVPDCERGEEEDELFII